MHFDHSEKNGQWILLKKILTKGPNKYTQSQWYYVLIAAFKEDFFFGNIWGHLIRYVFNDILVREICSFMFWCYAYYSHFKYYICKTLVFKKLPPFVTPYVLKVFAQFLIFIWNFQQLEYVLLHEFSSVLKCERSVPGSENWEGLELRVRPASRGRAYAECRPTCTG